MELLGFSLLASREQLTSPSLRATGEVGELFVRADQATHEQQSDARSDFATLLLFLFPSSSPEEREKSREQRGSTAFGQANHVDALFPQSLEETFPSSPESVPTHGVSSALASPLPLISQQIDTTDVPLIHKQELSDLSPGVLPAEVLLHTKLPTDTLKVKVVTVSLEKNEALTTQVDDGASEHFSQEQDELEPFEEIVPSHLHVAPHLPEVQLHVVPLRTPVSANVQTVEPTASLPEELVARSVEPLQTFGLPLPLSSSLSTMSVDPPFSPTSAPTLGQDTAQFEFSAAPFTPSSVDNTPSPVGPLLLDSAVEPPVLEPFAPAHLPVEPLTLEPFIPAHLQADRKARSSENGMVFATDVLSAENSPVSPLGPPLNHPSAQVPPTTQAISPTVTSVPPTTLPGEVGEQRQPVFVYPAVGNTHTPKLDMDSTPAGGIATSQPILAVVNDQSPLPATEQAAPAYLGERLTTLQSGLSSEQPEAVNVPANVYSPVSANATGQPLVLQNHDYPTAFDEHNGPRPRLRDTALFRVPEGDALRTYSVGLPISPASPPLTRRTITPGSVVIEQVAGEIATQIATGGKKAMITLEPQELGHVQIDLVVEGEQVQVRIVTETAEVGTLMQTHLAELKTALQHHNLELGTVSVDVNARGGGGEREASTDTAPRHFGSSHQESGRESLSQPQSSEQTERRRPTLVPSSQPGVSVWA